MNEEEMTKKLAESIEAFSEPINFDNLLKDGLLIRKGRSYYAPDINALPDKVSKRIKQVVPTKNGLRVTFYKEKSSMKRLSEKMKNCLD